ncbi:MAG: gamma-glutamyl-gamma-aminobutyrate hydrolase family protein, partial [Rickettsiales bacterium]
VHEMGLVDTFLDMIDGLVIIGGAFDVHPSLYGGGDLHDTVTLKETRTQFEWDITQKAVERNMPVLGICGGEQLLNVVLGGTLIQHIPDTVKEALAHEQPNPRTEPGHTVAVAENTLLHKIVGKTEINVNSAHHQAVAKPAPDCLVNATAPDGVIEGIELPGHPFCLGVQWHPEYHISPADTQIFEAFVAACKQQMK